MVEANVDASSSNLNMFENVGCTFDMHRTDDSYEKVKAKAKSKASTVKPAYEQNFNMLSQLNSSFAEQ